MDKKTERRSMKRQKCNCEANCAYFNKEGYFRGYLRNCSRGGSCIERAKPLIPGSTVLVRVLQCENSMAEHPHEIRFNSIAEVKWCKDMKEAESTRYAIGLRYHYPV